VLEIDYHPLQSSRYRVLNSAGWPFTAITMAAASEVFLSDGV